MADMITKAVERAIEAMRHMLTQLVIESHHGGEEDGVKIGSNIEKVRGTHLMESRGSWGTD